MKKILIATAAVAVMASSAFAERYVMVTHGQGTDPFWPVVEKGGKEAAAAVGADFEYRFIPSGSMADMAKLIEAATATQPDGLIVSLPDADALGGAIRGAVDAGIPVITINSGLEQSKSVGALMHVGQPEYLAGQKAGELAKAAGVTKPICFSQEAFNAALTERCNGYFDAIGVKGEIIDTTPDPITIRTRAAAALQADPDVNGALSVGPHTCVGVLQGMDDVGTSMHHGCFDLSPELMDAIDQGRVNFTIDQQQRLQGYLPVILLHLYNESAGLLPGANVPSGPGIVDQSNAAAVKALAGINR
jgi:simple sugar transport system substrate-binding protein